MAIAPMSYDSEALYKAIQKPETGGEENTFIRTKASPKSSAYGDVQITYSTIQNLLEKEPQLFEQDPELKNYAQRYVEQGKKFINADPNDPIYGLGGKGELGETEEDKANYKKLANTLIGYEWNRAKGETPDQKLSNFIQQWRGVPEEQDPRYYSSVRETLGAKAPTIENYLQLKNKTKEDATVYSEDNTTTNLNTALDPNSLIKYKLAGLKNNLPNERAEVGANLGSAVGYAQGGVVGGIIGAGVGAIAGRALGQLQSGEAETNAKIEKTVGVMNTVGIAEGNLIKFSDGAQFPIDFSPDYRLSNTTKLLTGSEDRSIYEIDISNPFAKRTENVAKPLAYLMTDAMSNQNKGADTTALNNMTGLLVNSLQTEARDIKTVYSRAKEMVAKLDIPEASARQYFNNIKGKLSKKEAESIKEGLDIIYGRV